MGEKIFVRWEIPFLTPVMKETHILRCKTLLNDFKKVKAKQGVMFNDKKIWIVYPVRNRHSDR
uniref:Uncharacterized protein n=1 Tax=Lepeophtheirus salmonis TaxID=72036 RepID=A0A0K2UTP5_LEPSM